MIKGFSFFILLFLLTFYITPFSAISLNFCGSFSTSISSLNLSSSLNLESPLKLFESQSINFPLFPSYNQLLKLSFFIQQHPIIIELKIEFKEICLYLMNQSNQVNKKTKVSRNHPKIHRRKNEQIPKQFFCTVQSCGKAYGSYAALYTHMKNKHGDVKPPNMPTTTKQKNGHPGRPKIKKNQEQKGEQKEVNQKEQQQVMCKICQAQECQCVQNFDSDQKKRTVEIMSCQKFTSFTNQIGQLSNQQVNWVRRTQEDFVFKSSKTILDEVDAFNQKYGLNANPTDKLVQYLSFSSKYWDPQLINELYNSIYAMIGIQNHQSCIKFIMESDFIKMQQCIKKNPNQFKRLESVVRVI